MTGDKDAATGRGRVPASGAAATSLYERYKDALRRGHVAALRGRNDAAIDAYGEAASLAPDRALPHASIAGILARIDRLDEATASYERALALAPRDEGALRGLAEVQVRTGRRAEAAATLDRLADALDAADRLADATDTARRALELAESRVRRKQVETLVARLRATPGNDEAAQRALDGALRLLEPVGSADDASSGASDRPPADRGAAATGLEAPGGPAREAGEPPAAEPEAAEPEGLGIALGVAAEAALHAGDIGAAHSGLLAAARAHRRAGRLAAAVDACNLAIGLAPADPEIHLLLAEVYLDRGWRSQAADKLLLLGRLAELDNDQSVRDRICSLAGERLPDEPRVAALCA